MYETELQQLDILVQQLARFGTTEVVARIKYEDITLPIHCVAIGNQSPEAPCIGFFAGVHGLEKIGSEVLISFMQKLLHCLEWDEELMRRLEKLRLVFMPIVNPVGVLTGHRSNGRGVDLMRNSPVEATGKLRIYSGHRLSSRLPWYRGKVGAPMEDEAAALCQVVRQYLHPSTFSMALDIHSGFGARDRLWFPYAKSLIPCKHLAQAMAIKLLFDKIHPHHFYSMEPVAKSYVIHGDLWDYLYEESLANDKNFFLPWTLEMGSWIWLRKTPKHFFNRLGLYHPILPHRKQRVLRRHLALFHFFQQLVLYPSAWLPANAKEVSDLNAYALKKWY